MSRQQTNKKCLARTAHWYAKRLGFKVLPLHGVRVDGSCTCENSSCPSPGKHPRTKHGLKDATSDLAIIEEWWRQWPDANIGIATGAASNAVVLDIDPRHRGDATLADLEAKHGKLPASVECLTGGGGRHIYLGPRGTEIKNSAGKLGPGLDIRGDGGYVVAPPSLHFSGCRYEWEASSRIGEVPFAPAPEWLLALTRKPGHRERSHQACSGHDAEKFKEGERNNRLTSLAGTMRRRGMSKEAIEAALLAENDARSDRPLDPSEIRRIVESISKYPPASGEGRDGTPTNGNSPSKATDSRPLVQIRHEEHEVTREVIAAIASGAPVFQRAGKLVHLVRHVRPTGVIKREPNSPYIASLSQPRLRELMTETIRWEKYSKTDKAWVSSHPPEWAVAQLHARGDWPSIRPLEAIIEAPVLRADGTILSNPGYDDETGFLYEPSGLTVEIAPSPSRADAERARDALLDAVSDFPFATDAHRSAWVAALLTTLARAAMKGDPAPLILLDSNVRGAGKSLLCDIIALIVTGRVIARTAYVHKDDEMRKRITTIALSGDALVLLDNVAGEFGCPSLDAALTGTVWEDRRLGVNEKIRALLITTWFATGNNIALVGDTSRRALHIRLDSTWERPEERRDFKHPNILEWVREQRPRLLAAALTILRAYFVAGCPATEVLPWGSYEAWTRTVRRAVMFAGLPDPADTREELITSADTETTLLKTVLYGLEKLDPQGKGFTAIEVLKKLDDSLWRFSTLRGSILELRSARNGELPDARGVGNLFRKMRNRTLDGRCLEKSRENRDGSAVWRVRRVAQSIPTAEHEASKTEDAGSADSAGSSIAHEPKKSGNGVPNAAENFGSNGAQDIPQTPQTPQWEDPP